MQIIPTEQLSEYYPFMPMDQFNKFIKDQNLTYGKHLKPVKDTKNWLFEAGWHGITAGLITDLIGLGWNKNIITIGERDGKGIFKIKVGTPKMFDRIKIWQNQCSKICQHCGSTEDVRTHNDPPNPLYSTDCVHCREKGDAFEKEIVKSLDKIWNKHLRKNQ